MDQWSFLRDLESFNKLLEIVALRFNSTLMSLNNYLFSGWYHAILASVRLKSYISVFIIKTNEFVGTRA